MRFTLKDYQTKATDSILKTLRTATRDVEQDPNSRWAVSLSAPTGSGKTVVASAVIETLFDGAGAFASDPMATILWVTDDPALNEQTKRKMLQAADTLTPGRLRTIDASFDSETFDPQRVYFLNIQKLARTNRLARSNLEKRTYTLWQTIDNTIRENGAHFYVVIDEAHRGMSAEGDRSTIVSQIIHGRPGQNGPAPIVWGISATPQRFEEAMNQGTAERTSKSIRVPIEDVRASGLLKDMIILDNPARSQHEGDTTLARAGVLQTLEFERTWNEYTQAQGEPPVLPVLVLQVHNSPTEEELTDLLAAVFGTWEGLRDSNVVNTFGEHSTLGLGGHVIRYMVPQDIQDDVDVRVVLCKDAISTGWDCPRAEVLVSLRKAEDYTYIAQLIGRMVRTPLARRVDSDQSLNTVNCFLPRFNKKEVQSIVERFRSGTNDEPPVDVTENPMRLWRNESVPLAVFEVLEKLPSYVVPGNIYRSQVSRAMALATLLSGDSIVEGAVKRANDRLLQTLEMRQDEKSLDGELQLAVRRIRSLKVERSYALLAAETLGDLPQNVSYEMALDDKNVDDLFRVSQRKLPEGLAKLYWSSLLDTQLQNAPVTYDPMEAKATVAALALQPDVIESIEAAAEELVKTWLRENQGSISQLPDARKALYEPVRREARNPELTDIIIPDSRIDHDTGVYWQKHVLSDEHGSFSSNPKSWEEHVLKTELANTETVAWYRNPTGGQGALRIPYPVDGRDKAMYPDFVFLTEHGGQIQASIVDPHGDHLADSSLKLRGLASYVEAHGDHFERVHSVIEDRDTHSFVAIDLKSQAVRDAIRSLGDQSVLSLYREMGGHYGS